MITVQYQILRYLPDRISGEFVNLGIVALDSSGKKLSARFINKIGKISAFFSNTNSKYLLKQVRTIQNHLELHSKSLISEFAFAEVSSLEEITRTALPKDDSALIFSKVKKALDISADSTVNDLFSRFVSVHLLEEDDEEIRKDKEVWQKIYKKHFDESGISSHLTTHSIKTKDDVLEFDRAPAGANGEWEDKEQE